MAEHNVNSVKPEKLARTGVGMLEQELNIANLFQKHSFDNFKGSRDDAQNIIVEGVLPFHLYKFRGNRDTSDHGNSTHGVSGPHEGSLRFDEFTDRKIQITLSGRAYSGVLLNDEQYDFDELQWGNILRRQSKAVARGLNRGAVDTLVNADYNVTIGGAESNLRGALIEARKVMNRFNLPAEERLLVVGSDFESALLNEEGLVLAQNVGDSRADSALGSATLGTLLGFTVVVDQTVPSDEAYAIVRSGFIFANAAPYVPQSVGYGATAAFEGVSLRWMRDYAIEETRDRSVVDCYYGFRTVEDILVGYNSATGTEVQSTSTHFVRGVKLTLDGTSEYPEAGSELATITGVSDANAWGNTGSGEGEGESEGESEGE